MENSNIKLQVAFPKSDQDHRLQLVAVNSSIFAIIHAPLQSDGDINLNCEDWNLILLSPINSKKKVQISAINLFCFSEIAAQEEIEIAVSKRLVTFSSPQSPKKVHESIGVEKSSFGDDPACLLQQVKLLNGLLTCIHDSNPDALLEAQTRFITFLCTLAEKIEGNQQKLNIQNVLTFWNIEF